MTDNMGVQEYSPMAGIMFCVAPLRSSSKCLNTFSIKNHSLIKFETVTKWSGAGVSTNEEVVGPIPLPVVSAVVWHLVLGVQHAHVRNTSVAAVTEVVHEAAGGPELGHAARTWLHLAPWVSSAWRRVWTSWLGVGCRSALWKVFVRA